MTEAFKEVSKLGGAPVFQIVVMGPEGIAPPSADRPQPAAQPEKQALLEELSREYPPVAGSPQPAALALERALHRGDGFARHEVAESLIFEGARGELIVRDNARDALHIDRNMNL